MNISIGAVVLVGALIPNVADTACWAQARISAKATTICDIAREPAKYSGETVRFRATVDSDGYEYTTLVDPECNNVGIGDIRYFSENWERNPKLKRFDDALGLLKPNSKQPVIRAVFTGRFSYDPNNTSPIKRRVFKIIEVDDLVVEK